MATLANLVVSLTAQNQQFLRAMDQSQRRTAAFEGGIKRLAGALGFGAGIAGGVNLARSLVRVGAEMETLRSRLKTVTGTASDATVAFNRIRDFAVSTPFQVQNLTDAFVRLKTFGIEPNRQTLLAFGDLASAFGRDITDVVRAVTGLVTGETEAIKSFGAVARVQGQQIALTFRGVTQTIQRDADAVVTALTNISTNNFAGAMTDQMNTLNGRVSNLTDAFANLADAVTTRVNPAMQGLLGSLAIIVNDIATLTSGGQGPGAGSRFPGIRSRGLRGDAEAIAAIQQEQTNALIASILGNVPRGVRGPGLNLGVRQLSGPITTLQRFLSLEAGRQGDPFSRLLGGLAPSRGLAGIQGVGLGLRTGAIEPVVRSAAEAMQTLRVQMHKMTGAADAAAIAHQQLAVSIITSVGAMVQNLIGGRGGLGGFLTGAAGVASVALTAGGSAVAGALVGAGGGILGALAGRDRGAPAPVRVVNFSEIETTDDVLRSIVQIILDRRVVGGGLTTEEAFRDFMTKQRRLERRGVLGRPA